MWYSPVLDHCIGGTTWEDVTAKGIESLLEWLDYPYMVDRYIFCIRTKELLDDDDGDVLQEFHAGVLTKEGGDWLILDTAEERQILLEPGNDAAMDWLQGIEQMSLYKFVGKKIANPKLNAAFLREWELIMSGELVISQGGHRHVKKSDRICVRKDARKNST